MNAMPAIELLRTLTSGGSATRAEAQAALDALVQPGDSTPVGAVEIAAMLGVERGTVDRWRQRDLGFPEPLWTVGGRPAWPAQVVLEWNAARKGTR